MRMTEVALEKIIDENSVTELYEIAISFGASKLRSYCLNFILREFEKINNKREFQTLSHCALDEIHSFLPRRMKRHANKTKNKNLYLTNHS